MPESLDSTAAPKRYFLVLFQSFGYGYLGELNFALFQDIQTKLDSKIDSLPENTEIDVWIESPGGDAHIAYKLFLDLQSRCSRFRLVIPDYAKSAATLLALGADEIFMAPAAELGPLDAQVEHPDREGVTVSALDVSKALGFIGNFGLDFVTRGGRQVLGSTLLPRADVLREWSRFVAAFLRPVVSKIDPHLIHRAGNQLDVARRYASIMMELRRLSPGDKSEAIKSNDLVSHLVEHYPAHEFVISRKEASEMPLPVRKLEDYEYGREVRLLHRMFHQGELAADGERSVIRIFDTNDLELYLNPNDADEKPGERDDENRRDADATKDANAAEASDDSAKNRSPPPEGGARTV